MSRVLVMIAVMTAVAVPFAASARGHGFVSAGTEMASRAVTPTTGTVEAAPAPSPSAVITRVLPTPTPDLTAPEDSGSKTGEYIVIGLVLSVLGLLVVGLLVAWWVVGD